jgi:hypothetical protein
MPLTTTLTDPWPFADARVWELSDAELMARARHFAMRRAVARLYPHPQRPSLSDLIYDAPITSTDAAIDRLCNVTQLLLQAAPIHVQQAAYVALGREIPPPDSVDQLELF